MYHQLICMTHVLHNCFLIIFSSPEGAQLKPFDKVKKTMSRWRSENRP